MLDFLLHFIRDKFCDTSTKLPRDTKLDRGGYFKKKCTPRCLFSSFYLQHQKVHENNRIAMVTKIRPWAEISGKLFLVHKQKKPSLYPWSCNLKQSLSVFLFSVLFSKYNFFISLGVSSSRHFYNRTWCHVYSSSVSVATIMMVAKVKPVITKTWRTKKICLKRLPGGALFVPSKW